ncbi:MFS-type transporter involved in bile tolerance (Atg22 family) [Microbacterium proteolyticum]|nr:MFS-type transporter involved in bile tolerance (Atg22 family) [Microbacterium proteolyticum]
MTDMPSPGPAPSADHARRPVLAWALWDWGSAAFNAVVTTFVFSTYLASSLFVDPAVVAAANGNDDDPALVRALADNASVVGVALMIAGIVVALVAPVLGQRSDGTGRRKLWLGVNTGLIVLAMAAMVFVEGSPPYLVLGATLLAVGNVFFEFASVNYYAMLTQVSTRENIGRVSGFGWGMGYVGGIVLLVLLLVLFIQSFGDPDAGGVLAVPEEGGLNIRLAVLASAIWYAVFAIPVLLRVPEIPAQRRQVRVGFFRSYAVLWGTLRSLWRDSRQVLLFLVASAVFRDGLAGVFTFGAIIAAQVFRFSSTEVLYFAVAANLVAGVSVMLAGRLDDRFGPEERDPRLARRPHRAGDGHAVHRHVAGGLLDRRPGSRRLRRPRAVGQPVVPRPSGPRGARGGDLRPLRHDGPGGVVSCAGPVRAVRRSDRRHAPRHPGNRADPRGGPAADAAGQDEGRRHPLTGRPRAGLRTSVGGGDAARSRDHAEITRSGA